LIGRERGVRLVKLAPALAELKERYAADSAEYMRRTLALYAQHGLTIMDVRSLLAAVAQMPVLLGMYQVLRNGVQAARFLWIAHLSRPDDWIALLAGFTTLLIMTATPDLPENMRLVMLIVPAVLATVVALKCCSALAVYWTVSNGFSAAQTLILHRVVARRIRSGAIDLMIMYE
jgi:YidC/Oxa1 family membrane protein insertase